jgi:hypothetical protein
VELVKHAIYGFVNECLYWQTSSNKEPYLFSEIAEPDKQLFSWRVSICDTRNVRT